MNARAASPVPTCPACSEVGARWEIVSPVAAEDRVRLDPAGLTELGLFGPEGGLEPLGRPVIRCVACGTTATEDVAGAVLRAAVVANHGHGTPGDA